MHRSQVRAASAAVALALLLASCTSTTPARPGPPGPTSPTPSVITASVTPSPSPPASITVAYVEALDGEESGDVVPAFQGIRLAFSIAEVVGGLSTHVEVVTYDTGWEPARTAEVAAEIAARPDVVAAIGAPGLGEQDLLGDALGETGVPWISLSGTGAALAARGWTGWRRLVADAASQGEVLAGVVESLRPSRRGVCVLGDGTPEAREILDAVVRNLGARPALRTLVADEPTDVTAAVDEVAEIGCGVVLWGGDGAQGAAVRRRLVEDGLRAVAFVGTGRIRDAGYLEAAGPAGEGTLAIGPCVDVSTSTELAAQRFIQDYQSDYGLPPGPCAVEGWDAARILVTAVRAGAVTREDLGSALDALSTFDGLAGTYRFEAGGDLALPRRSVGLSRVEGGRWLAVERSAPLP